MVKLRPISCFSLSTISTLRFYWCAMIFFFMSHSGFLIALNFLRGCKFLFECLLQFPFGVLTLSYTGSSFPGLFSFFKKKDNYNYQYRYLVKNLGLEDSKLLILRNSKQISNFNSEIWKCEFAISFRPEESLKET